MRSPLSFFHQDYSPFDCQPGCLLDLLPVSAEIRRLAIPLLLLPITLVVVPPHPAQKGCLTLQSLLSPP
uniref:Uncharacterized protein n=1 Tax=Chromera velia CCMP2878 TaxID=1169474 RepID=A0A0G4H6D4_9ALVE|eukprot:Cvel_24875.t1-p1 / transcript=Cvel_24875.t1 / gene=Cvel_24875 / organism=Chromera_velia_CCMP2878 / gene_product=hypothetical protein / transcript_product=hypothetical protein / location=Cvel_scaffold2748:21587-21790(-) / protein_length=68 / sequence_SO=supercontig / SO=protein_coding / is_pseudo=false